ncbi:EamA/RhaT family transporter [Erysipelotrichaceae bacterium AF15-26LB]|nr:DMT family transporter [[Clostridium] innocuum]RJV89941.1 EamA/RhaT family transporter [Erysipelotrichaceae bacterium AF19-24AC]RJV90488.1 EamA/RhaT family transporter [Erysipelotrichaceae bacterium AF15-26LB]
MSKHPMAAYLSAMFLFGTLGLFVRQAEVTSEVLACLRTLIGAVFLGGVLLFQKQRVQKIHRRQVCYVLLSALFLGFNWVFLFEAYANTTISIATVIYYTAPLLALVAAVLLFHERIGRRDVMGIALTMIGLLFITRIAYGGMQMKGIVFAALAAVCYAGVLLTNRCFQEIDGLYFTFLQLLFSSGILLIYLLMEGRVPEISRIPLASWPWIFCIGILHTGIAYVLYFTSLHALSSSHAAIGSYLDPCVALLLSVMILQEPASLLQGIGIAAILGGILLHDSSA